MEVKNTLFMMSTMYDDEKKYWWRIDSHDNEEKRNYTFTISDKKDLSGFVMSFNMAAYSIPECEEMWKLNFEPK